MKGITVPTYGSETWTLTNVITTAEMKFRAQVSGYSFFLNRPLLPYGVEGFLLVNPSDNWYDSLDG
jgi:hypothetical protein